MMPLSHFLAHKFNHYVILTLITGQTVHLALCELKDHSLSTYNVQSVFF